MRLDVLPWPVAELWPVETLMDVDAIEHFMPSYEPELTDAEFDAMTIESARQVLGGLAALARHRRRRDEEKGLVGISSKGRKPK